MRHKMKQNKQNVYVLELNSSLLIIELRYKGYVNQ